MVLEKFFGIETKAIANLNALSLGLSDGRSGRGRNVVGLVTMYRLSNDLYVN